MLPKENRLRKEKDHNKVYRKGRRDTCNFFVLLSLTREDKKLPSRFSFVVSKKVDKRAVARNRIRRVLKESVRAKLPDITKGYDCIVIARKGILGLSVNDILPTIVSVFQKAKLLNIDEKDTVNTN